MRDHLNSHVKFREPFRPYAASVLAEHASEYFDLAVDDPFMLIVAPVRRQRAATIPSVTHADGTCRIQSVRVGHPGAFRTLVESFHRRTGVPLVLNTSFNIRGEPIVETPDDALQCFLASNIDVLYLAGRRVTKVRASAHPDPGGLLPALSPGLALELHVPTQDGAARDAMHSVRTRTGHRALVTAAEFALLNAVDGARSIDEIAGTLAMAASDASKAFIDLQQRGLVAFRSVDAGPWPAPPKRDPRDMIGGYLELDVSRSR